MHLVHVSYAYDDDCSDPEDLLERYATLTGWGESMLGAGASAVTTVQRFGSDHIIRRGGVEYRFVADRGSAQPRLMTPTLRTNRAAARLLPESIQVHGLIYPLQTRQLRNLVPAGAALLLQDHGGADPEAFGVVRRLASRFLRCADGFLFSAAPQSEPWCSAGILSPADRILELMEASTKVGPVALTAPILPGKPAILWVGRLIPDKDPLTVVEAFRRALRELPEAHLTLVYQEDPLEADIRAAAASSPELAGRIHLVGNVAHPQIAEYYSSAQIFVLGSRREGSGYALIEALAGGVAAVVTDIPSFRALTDGGRLGALFPPGDPAACAEALVRVARSDPSRQRERIRADFEARLSWPALAARALEYHRMAVALRRLNLGRRGGGQ